MTLYKLKLNPKITLKPFETNVIKGQGFVSDSLRYFQAFRNYLQ